jgi:alkylated DNA repair dioxygenase AlkB
MTEPTPTDSPCRYTLGWLGCVDADALLALLVVEVPWEHHRLRLFGREINAPRLSCWIGDADAGYTYSRVRYEPHPWPDALLAIRERLLTECGVDFNGVLANFYRDGGDSMGWHSDDEPEIDRDAPIASLSLGAARRFVLRRRDDRAQRFTIELGHGSLLLMAGGMQHDWQHALPKTARAIGPRINLTFRRMVGRPQ